MTGIKKKKLMDTSVFSSFLSIIRLILPTLSGVPTQATCDYVQYEVIKVYHAVQCLMLRVQCLVWSVQVQVQCFGCSVQCENWCPP